MNESNWGTSYAMNVAQGQINHAVRPKLTVSADEGLCSRNILISPTLCYSMFVA